MAEIVIKLVNGELAGKTMQSINKDVNAAAVALKKAEVGTEAWVNAHKKLEDAKKLQGDLKKQIDSTTSASDTLKKTFGGILNQIPGFGALSGMFNQAKSGVGGLTSGFGLLKSAMLAVPIFLLIAAITAVVGWFTKTEQGANIVSGAFKGMGAVIDTLMSRLWNIGDTLKQLFSNPVKFFKDLGKDIKTAAVEGYDLVQVFDDIEDRQRDLAVSSKEQEIAIDRLLLQAKNAGKAYDQKLALLAKADDMTRASYKEQLALSKEYLDAVEREVEAADKTGKLGDDLLDKRKDAKLAYLSLVQEEVQIEEKIQNRRDQILEKKEKADEKSAEKKSKLLDKEAKDLEASLKKLEDLRIKSIDELEAREIAEVNLKYERELESLTLQGEQKIEAEKLIEEVKGQEIQVIRDKYAAIQAEKDKKILDDKIAQLDLELAIEQNGLNKKILARQITEEQFVVQSAQNVVDNEAKKLEIIKAAHGEQSIEYQRAYGNFLMLQKNAGDAAVAAQKKTGEDLQKAILATTSTFGSVFSLLADQYEQGTEQWKTFAIAAATMSAIQGAINAYTSAAAIPYVGTILAPIAAATALAAGYAQVRKIQNTKATPPAKKELGGPLYGPRHSQGGIDINAEGGEFIFSRKAVEGIGMDNLTRVNDHFTRKLEFGGPTNPFQDVSRGPVSRNNTRSLNSPSSSMEVKPPWVDELIASQDRRIDRIKVHNVVSETDDGIKTLNQIKEDADV